MGSNCIDNLNYVEKEKVQSVTDSLILWDASCGYYATKVQALVDLASGFEDSIQKDPSADQTISGDFKLIQDGISFSSYIAPNELSIKSKANGGFDLAVDTNGLTTIKAKGVPVQTYDENGVNMLEKLKMPIGYTSVDANDVVVKSELTAVEGDVAAVEASVTAVEQEVDAIQANYAKTDEENTFQEKQTLEDGADVTGLVTSQTTGINHNTASFIFDSVNETLVGAPDGWSLIKDSNFDFHIVHGLEKLVYPTAIAADAASIGAFVTFADAFKGGGVLNACRFIVRGGDSVPVTVPVSVRINLSF